MNRGPRSVMTCCEGISRASGDEPMREPVLVRVMPYFPRERG